MLVNENDGHLFAENFHLSNIKGVRKVDRQWLKLNDVLVDPESNVARYGGTNSKLVEELKYSFNHGIRFNDFLPIVKKLAVNKTYDDGHLKFFELVDGYNRITALKELGYTHYWFDIADFGYDGVSPVLSQTTLAITMNAPVPKVPSSDKDLYVSVTNLVFQGELEKDFEKIKHYIRETAKVPPARAHAVASQVAAATGAPNTLYIWSGAMIKKDVGALGIQSYGKYDSSRDQHGWTVLEGYEPDAIMNALAKLYDTGKTSYFTGHTKIPDSVKNLNDHRFNLKNNMDQREKHLIAMCEYYNEHNRLPFDFIGFLPQSQKEERTELVQIK